MCDSTSVGRLSASITLAIVNVLPEPVTPSSVCAYTPASKLATSFSMACAWSPASRNGATRSNGFATPESFGSETVAHRPEPAKAPRRGLLPYGPAVASESQKSHWRVRTPSPAATGSSSCRNGSVATS